MPCLAKHLYQSSDEAPSHYELMGAYFPSRRFNEELTHDDPSSLYITFTTASQCVGVSMELHGNTSGCKQGQAPNGHSTRVRMPSLFPCLLVWNLPLRNIASTKRHLTTRTTRLLTLLCMIDSLDGNKKRVICGREGRIRCMTGATG